MNNNTIIASVISASYKTKYKVFIPINHSSIILYSILFSLFHTLQSIEQQNIYQIDFFFITNIQIETIHAIL